MKGGIAVAMSGGVDSSVAAALLKAEGRDVFGVTMRLLGEGGAGEDNIRAAASVCETLGIPHAVVDLREDFRQKVIEYFVDEYASGRTPNPCVICNELVKFGLLMDLAGNMGADRLATGHYARIVQDSCTGRYGLLKARDAGKDQSYFLYRLSQARLGRALFPLGTMTKKEVREKAAAMGLPTAGRAESQEVCFIPPRGDYRDLVEAMRPGSGKPGEFVDTSGRVVGTHRGVAYYTIGQRKGLGVSSPLGRRYVIDRDRAANRVTLGGADDLKRPGCLAGGVNWVAVGGLDGPREADVKLRYRCSPVKATLVPEGDGSVRVEFSRPEAGVSPGQSAVFYDGETVQGGGIITG